MKIPKILGGLKNTLASKLAVWLFLLSLFPIGIIMIFLSPNVSSEFLELSVHDLEEDARLLATQLQFTEINKFLNESGQNFCRASIEESEKQAYLKTKQIFIIDDTGTIISSKNNSCEGEVLSLKLGKELVLDILQKKEGNIFNKEDDQITVFSRVIGKNLTVVISADKSDIIQPINRIHRVAFIQLGVSFLLIIIIGSIAIMILLKPVYMISKAAEQVGQGNLAIRIDPSLMEGELEVLAKSFNNMAESLEKSKKEVEKSNLELEKKVLERTKELAEKNEELGKFNKMAVDRELKMVELKKRIKELEDRKE